jgi:hypothetical protein
MGFPFYPCDRMIEKKIMVAGGENLQLNVKSTP